MNEQLEQVLDFTVGEIARIDAITDAMLIRPRAITIHIDDVRVLVEAAERTRAAEVTAREQAEKNLHNIDLCTQALQQRDAATKRAEAAEKKCVAWQADRDNLAMHIEKLKTMLEVVEEYAEAKRDDPYNDSLTFAGWLATRQLHFRA